MYDLWLTKGQSALHSKGAYLWASFDFRLNFNWEILLWAMQNNKQSIYICLLLCLKIRIELYSKKVFEIEYGLK